MEPFLGTVFQVDYGNSLIRGVVNISGSALVFGNAVLKGKKKVYREKLIDYQE